MIAVLAPAMNMARVDSSRIALTQPAFLTEAQALAEELKEFSSWELEALLGIGPEKALQVSEDYLHFGETPTPAGLSFRGLAFQYLNLANLSAGALLYAQEHLRILSALCGVLRPLDGVSLYRLDFVCQFGRQNKLYGFWGDRVYRALFQSEEVVVNLCSGEYEKLVRPYLSPGDRWVTCRFLVYNRGKLRCQATAAKMTRGRMAREIIKNRWESPDELKAFVWEGYRFVPHLSGETELIFVQDSR